MENTLVVLRPEELTLLIKKAIQEAMTEMKRNEIKHTLLSRNKIKEKYNLTYPRQQKLIDSNNIKMTSDGLIVEQSVIDYISK